MIKIKLALLVCTMFCVVKDLAIGQTAGELHQQFGKPEEVYIVRENVAMTAKYGEDGQVCQMSFFPRHVSAPTVYLGGNLALKEIAPIIETLVPQSARGKAGIGGFTIFGGGMGTTFYAFEKITITLHFSFALMTPAKREKDTDEANKQSNERSQTVETDLHVKESQRKDDSKIFDSIFSGSAEVINIYWNKRKCPSIKKVT